MTADAPIGGSDTASRDYSRLASTVFDRASMRRLSVLVIGAGALGNEVLKNLALLGVGNITIVDRDVIERSNLTRSVLFCTPDIHTHIANRTPKAEFAAARVRELNPDTSARWIAGEFSSVGLGVTRRMDLVFSCVDNEIARLEISWACTRADRPLADAGLGLLNYSTGQVSIFPGSDGPCYACRKPTERRRRLFQELQSREDPCWMKQAAADEAGAVITTPLTSSAIAGLQVELGLRFVSDAAHDRTTGISTRLTLHPGPSLDTARFDRSATCPLHEPSSALVAVREFPELRSADCSPARLFEAAGVRSAALLLDWPITARATCRSCSHECTPFVRRSIFRTLACPTCGSRDLVELNVLTSITDDSPWASRALRDLGQPSGHVYAIVTQESGDTIHAELTGDLSRGSRQETMA